MGNLKRYRDLDRDRRGEYEDERRLRGEREYDRCRGLYDGDERPPRPPLRPLLFDRDLERDLDLEREREEQDGSIFTLM